MYLRLMMKTAADISSKIPTPLTDSSRKAELTPSPIRGKGSNRREDKKVTDQILITSSCKVQCLLSNY